MGYRVWLLVGLLLLPWPGWGKASPGEERAGQLLIQFEEGRLTVQARAVAHRQILEALARELHFELRLAGPLEQPRSLAIDRQPWERALKTALAPASWASLYEATPEGPRLRQVVVVPPQEAETAPRPGDRTPAASPDPTAAHTSEATREAAGHVPALEERLDAIARLGPQVDVTAVYVLADLAQTAPPSLHQRVRALLGVLAQAAAVPEVQQLAAAVLGHPPGPLPDETAAQDR
jgi:hypothetical protein